MSSSRLLRIAIEIDVGTAPIHGRCRVEGHPNRRSFTGWTELFAALDTAVADAGREPGGVGASLRSGPPGSNGPPR